MTGLAVRRSAQDIGPFSRDRLYLSIYESCKHRPTAITDAAALTQTAISLILGLMKNGVVERQDIVTSTSQVLSRFDVTAAAVYGAFHKVTS